MEITKLEQGLTTPVSEEVVVLRCCVMKKLFWKTILQTSCENAFVKNLQLSYKKDSIASVFLWTFYSCSEQQLFMWGAASSTDKYPFKVIRTLLLLLSLLSIYVFTSWCCNVNNKYLYSITANYKKSN